MRTSRAIHTEIGVAEHQEAARAVLTNQIRGPRAAAPLLAQTTESLTHHSLAFTPELKAHWSADELSVHWTSDARTSDRHRRLEP